MTQRKQKRDDGSLFISCVIPAHNEAEGIAEFIAALDEALAKITQQHEMIVIDDGSTDDTTSIIESLLPRYPQLRLLSFTRNFGKEIAITAGLEHTAGDVTVILDSDFQHPLELIPEFINKWVEGYDMVYGIRENRNHDSLGKRLFTRCFYGLMQRITPTNIPANAGDFRLLDRTAVNALNNCKERNRFMKGLYGWIGGKSIAVPFTVAERKTGNSSWPLRKLVELALTGITSFSTLPLRASGFIGLLVACLSLSYAVFVVLRTLLFGIDVPGYATIIVSVMFFGGVQLLSVGILGEYIGRIFDEVKQRPQYLISKKIGFNDE